MDTEFHLGPFDAKILGNVIRDLRLSKHITSDWVALKLGYKDKSSYCKLERGEIKEISIWKLLKICKLFDYEIIQLLKDAKLIS